ncbi:phosphotransferase [Xanthomonadaceae bacterium JHOS43]|nr:phosphotransferase [Xanthomonadaceae bacterium JHOS43]
MSDFERAALRLAFVQAHLGNNASEPVAASSDAGFRSYWRTRSGDGRSAIVMDSPPGLDDVRPWLRLHALFDAGGVRVPTVLACDVDAGFLLLEDLGGQTLLQIIDADNAATWFDHALDQLLRIQRIALPDDFPAYTDALVRRELALFSDWFLERHLGVELDANEQAALGRIFDHLATAFLAQPQVPVHRDFMPRNLMPLTDGLAVLDFQDAVRGPLAYDVLSCFKDAFLSWPQSRIDAWTARWRDAMRDAGLAVPAAEAFARDLDLTGVQRHLKVLGIFARLKHRDGKPHYIVDAPRFVAYLDAILPRHPELASLHTLLQRRVLPAIQPMALPQ